MLYWPFRCLVDDRPGDDLVRLGRRVADVVGVVVDPEHQVAVGGPGIDAARARMSRPSRSTTVRVSARPVASSSATRTCLWLTSDRQPSTIAPTTPSSTIATSSSTRVIPSSSPRSRACSGARQAHIHVEERLGVGLLVVRAGSSARAEPPVTQSRTDRYCGLPWYLVRNREGGANGHGHVDPGPAVGRGTRRPWPMPVPLDSSRCLVFSLNVPDRTVEGDVRAGRRAGHHHADRGRSGGDRLRSSAGSTATRPAVLAVARRRRSTGRERPPVSRAGVGRVVARQPAGSCRCSRSWC